MEPKLLRTLRARRRGIARRWEALLRVEPVTTPLAHPDTLVFLIEETLRGALAELAASPGPLPALPVVCACGRHPLLAFFAAGEQALLEALVLAQAQEGPEASAGRALAVEEMRGVVRLIARREVGAFAGVCQYRAAIERRSRGRNPKRARARRSPVR